MHVQYLKAYVNEQMKGKAKLSRILTRTI